MVSVEALSAYWLPLRANPFTNFFLDFLDEKPDLAPLVLNPSDTDSVVSNLLFYVRRADSAAATSLYQKLATRQVRVDSEWIHNDYLVFALVCVVQKFQLDGKWVRQVLHNRPNADATQRLINKSFDNLLAGNHNAKEDYHQISIAYQLITQQEQFDGERLHKMFAYLWRHSFPYFESEFLNIVSLRAIRAAFEAKGLTDIEQRFVAEKFAHQFLKRVAKISKILTYSLFILIIIAMSTGAIFYAENKWVKGILAGLTTLGLGASFFADIRSWVALRVEKLVQKFWGYSVNK